MCPINMLLELFNCMLLISLVQLYVLFREAVKLWSSHKSFLCFHTCKIPPVDLWRHVYSVCGWTPARPEVISGHEHMHVKDPGNKLKMHSIRIQADRYKNANGM